MSLLDQIFFTKIENLLNIQDKTAKKLSRLKITTLRDLLFHTPYNYKSYKINPNLITIENNDLVILKIVEIKQISYPNKLPIKFHAKTKDNEALEIIYFKKIPNFIYKILLSGDSFIIKGAITKEYGISQLSHPELILKNNLHLVKNVNAIYHLTYGVNNDQLTNYIKNGFDYLERKITLLFKTQLKNEKDKEDKKHIENIINALKRLHLLDNEATKNPFKIINSAISELAYYELANFQIKLKKIKDRRLSSKTNKNTKFHQNIERETIEKDIERSKFQILKNFGYELTDCQIKTLEEINKDQRSNYQMMRMVQGDVGSGKTIVALLSMIFFVTQKKQSALMAPTDILANQHYVFFTSMLEHTNISCILITGKLTKTKKEQIQKEINEGKYQIIIGTHALFQDAVEFHDLGYIVIDEQHRFGVNQRSALMYKGKNIDGLFMSATPIPRSLALIKFANMDISSIKTKPSNRLPIITNIISSQKINELIKAIERLIIKGDQIYWICPLIENQSNDDEEDIDCYKKQEIHNILDQKNQFNLQNIIDIKNMLSSQPSSHFKENVDILHGKMKPKEKEEKMLDFLNKKFQILVATTVVEVGIDIKNASLIIIDNAERFGLSSLHQLRGRVGRSDKQSYCVLLTRSKYLSKLAKTRLKILKESNDGFYIANQDLLLRGEGKL